MEDFAKKLIVLVLLAAFFGALFLEAPILYKKIQNGEILALAFLRYPDKEQSTEIKNYNGYNGKSINNNGSSSKDGSYASPINIPAIDGINY